MKKKKLILGIDIGGTNTVFGFINDEGKYLSGGTIPTRGERDPDKFVARLVKNINTSFDSHKTNYTLEGIGVAAPSVNYLNGTIETPSNLEWGDFNLVTLMKEYFKIPVAVINDANAAALGEYYYGHAKGLRNFIVITLGTGVGAGIFVDGNMLYGERGLAGELGHIIAVPGGRKCNCGRSGCIETYISATGIKRTVFEMIAHHTDASNLRDFTFNELTGQMISDLASEGDSLALKAYEYTGKILGRVMANLSAHFSPELIILFGGLVNSGELLMEPARHYFEELLLNVHKGKIQVVVSKLNNATAGIYGASRLILSQLQSAETESGYV